MGLIPSDVGHCVRPHTPAQGAAGTQGLVMRDAHTGAGSLSRRVLGHGRRKSPTFSSLAFPL